MGVGWPRKTHLVSLCFLVLVWAEGPKGSRDQLDPPLASQEAGHSLKNLQVLVILEAMLLKAMAMQILKLNQLGNHPSSFHTYLLLQEILAQRKSCTATVLAALAASARLPNHLVRLHPWLEVFILCVEEWKITCHIGKQRMSQSPAIAAAVYSELMNPEGTQEGKTICHLAGIRLQPLPTRVSPKET